MRVAGAGSTARRSRGLGGFRFHQATPPGEGAVTLFELYGDGVEPVLERLFRPRRGALPAAGASAYGVLNDTSGDPVDDAILTRHDAIASWNGVPCWNLSLHGSVWVAARTRELFQEVGGVSADLSDVLRLALEYGTLDAAQAAAYEALIASRTEEAAEFFLRQFGGELSTAVAEIVVRLSVDRAGAIARLDALLGGKVAASRLAAPLRVLIAGPPNAGKSTLFNRLVESERVAVTEIAGTTRDTVEEPIALLGFPILLADSAGLRSEVDATTPIERLGIEQTRENLADDAVHVLLAVPPPWDSGTSGDELLPASVLESGRVLRVGTKSDLVGDGRCVDPPPSAARLDVVVSAPNGEGLDRLRRTLAARWLGGANGSGPVRCAPFRRRQCRILERARARLASPDVDLDGVRKLLIECVQSSWPESENDRPESQFR